MPKCFVIMPISTPDPYIERYTDQDHFSHVFDHLFVPALEGAGYEAVPPIVSGSELIHAEIIRNLETCDLVLCDISTLNANVFFELGIRTSLDRPIALVRDGFTAEIPFDTGSISTHTYDASLQPWKLKSEVPALTLHIRQVVVKSDGRNALWRYFGLTQRAAPADIGNPVEAKLDWLIGEVARLRNSSRPAPEPFRSAFKDDVYPHSVSRAISGMGYAVESSPRDISYDLVVADQKGNEIYVEVFSSQTFTDVISRAKAASVPVLFVAPEVPASVREEIRGSGVPVLAVQWQGERDNMQLEIALQAVFAIVSQASVLTKTDQTK